MQVQEKNLKEKELFVRWGTPAAEAMFDFPCNFFRIPEVDGVIPYRLEYGCAVVFGEPLASSNDVDMLIDAFHKFARQKDWNIIYIVVSNGFARLMMEKDCKILIEACEELIFNPQENPCEVSSRFRHRVERGIAHGLTAHEYSGGNEKIENKLRKVGVDWEKAIKGPHIYLGHLDFFASSVGKRWFYVKDGDEIISMAMLSRIEAKKGWLLKFLITKPKVFHDTSEFLVNYVLETLRNEGCCFLSKGMVPKEHLGQFNGLGAATIAFARGLYRLIGKVFKFDKRKEYWLRYHPKLAPSYLVFMNKAIGLSEIKALVNVFKTDYLSKQ